ncbi:twin-arginine translocase TatA/TatE family subunit [Streptosporangiaceae bacterium NEAU-GS5]|nr:twin-arginine translocase TatA/TatE family subunit [Streptosporangiaceae bacterium NEAU-GS5]
MFQQLGAPELLIIGVVLILLFGAKKLPDTARALGQSMRLFKKEVKKDGEDTTVVQAETVPNGTATPAPASLPASSSVEDRLAALEAENARLKAAAEPTVNGVPLSQVQNDKPSS